MSEKQKRGPRGMGHVYKKRSIWMIQYYHRRKRVRESSGSTRKKDAVDLLKQRLEEVRKGTFIPRSTKLTFAEGEKLLEADYRLKGRKSWSRAKQSLNRLRDVFGDDELADITAHRLQRYATYRIKEGAARATVVNELAALKRIFSLAMEQNLLAYRPAFPQFGKLKNARQEFIEPADYAALMAQLATGLQGYSETHCAVAARMVTFAYLTGWRWKSEVRGMEWSQVDFEHGVVSLYENTTKNDEPRRFPFADWPDLRAVLEEQHRYTESATQRTGKPVRHVWHVEGQPFTANSNGPRSFYQLWNRLCDVANVQGRDGKHKILHDNRRTSVRRLEWEGVPRKVAMQLIGHKTDAMYDRYHIVRDDDLREAVRRAAGVPSPEVEPVSHR